MFELGAQRVLDPCSGSRMFWFDSECADAVFGDIRREEHVLCDGRVLKIEPDLLMDFREIPFPDGSFKLVVFDPPHLESIGDKAWMKLKYGRLSENWRDDLRAGFAECFRVLDADGVLIFKWNQTQIPTAEILEMTNVRPMFGNISGKRANTHWIVFMKPRAA